jgi:outer membrane protein assembly factor BamB
VVYVGSTDKRVYALNASTGALLWSFPTGGAVYSSPAVANGVVYIGSDDGNVYALSASTGGALLWSFTAGNVVRSSPAVANGVVYVGPDDGNVYAFDASTGGLLWSFATGVGISSSPAVANGVVYVSSDKLYALNASTGALLWSSTNGAGGFSPTVANGVVYVGSNDNNVYALNASTGAVLWSQTPVCIDRYEVCHCVLIRPWVAVADGVAYVKTFNSNDGGWAFWDSLFALDASTGAILWQDEPVYPDTSAPAVANGVLYASWYGSWFSIAAFPKEGGQFIWYFQGVGHRFDGSSPVVVNGVVYAGLQDGSLYAFRLPPKSLAAEDGVTREP